MKDAGAVELITAARQNHPYCNDVAFAALRDLGTGAKYKE